MCENVENCEERGKCVKRVENVIVADCLERVLKRWKIQDLRNAWEVHARLYVPALICHLVCYFWKVQIQVCIFLVGLEDTYNPFATRLLSSKGSNIPMWR